MSVEIIKARAARGTVPLQRIRKDTHNASADAKTILEEAQARAAEVIETARAEESGIRAEACKQGYAEGLEQWNDALAEAWRLREQFLVQNTPELIRLAVAVAEKVIGHAVESDASIVLNTVRGALKWVPGEKLTIQVNPAEEDRVRKQLQSLQTLLNGVRELAVLGNPSIAPGGCIVKSELGIVDAQLPVQLAALEKSLLRRFSDDRG